MHARAAYVHTVSALVHTCVCRRVVKCPDCPIGGLVSERLDTHMRHMCQKRSVVGLFDLDIVLAFERPNYEEPEKGDCSERLQRCRQDFLSRRIKVRNAATGEFDTATIMHYRETDGRFRIQFPDGFKWRYLGELDFVIADDSKWDCGYISASQMSHHMLTECPKRAVMCRLGCGQRVLERGREVHESEQCGMRTVLCPLKCGHSMAAEDILEHCEELCTLREVYCGSCGLAMPFPDLEKHVVTDCPLAVSRCPQGCGKDLKVGSVDTHLSEECVKRIVTCPDCNDSSLFADELPLHLAGTLRDQECGARTIPCTLGCGEPVVAAKLPDHLQNSCHKRTITCECGFELIAETHSDHKILDCPAVIRYCSLGCGEKMRVMEMKEHQSTTCEMRHLAGGKLVACTLGCGVLVSFAEQFTHMTSSCTKRIVECVNKCSEVVRFEDQDEHSLVCRNRRVTCGNKSKVCLRQVRCWFARDNAGKKQLVCCENHQSNALMWAVEKGETKVSALCNLLPNLLSPANPPQLATARQLHARADGEPRPRLRDTFRRHAAH